MSYAYVNLMELYIESLQQLHILILGAIEIINCGIAFVITGKVWYFHALFKHQYRFARRCNFHILPKHV